MIHRTFRHRGPASLFGEIRDWRNAIPLEKKDDGSFAREIALAAGVYQYKLLAREGDRAVWILDDENTRTRSEGGRRNNIVVVDGAPEPWLFAPESPWVSELHRGGARVLVGVRKPVPPNVAIAWSEDGSTRTRAVAEHAFEEDEHTFFVAHLASSAPAIQIALFADDAPRFECTFRRAPASERAPAWWTKAAVYTIFVDRFRPAVDHDGWLRDPGKRGAAGGHLEGIRRSLDTLRELGFDTLYLTPVHVGASIHRYDLVDPMRVDPALGGEDAYRALIADAHARGMHVLQDISFAHAGRGFPAFEDVLVNGRSSRFASWFVWNDEGLVHYGKRTDAPLLDLENAEIQALVLDTVAFWAKLGASGLRLDMTAEVPLDLGRLVRKRFKELVPDGVVLGEVVPQHAWRWRNAGVVDAATDFGFHEVITDLVCRHDASAAVAFADIERRSLLRGGDPRTSAVRFLSTHDHPRLASLAAACGATDKLLPAYALLATMPGVPMLLYGEEIGIRAREVEERELEDVWPDRMPLPWSGRDAAFEAKMKELFGARRDSEALRTGTLRLLFADATTLVFRREAAGEIVDVAISFDGEPKTIELDDDEYPRLVPRALSGGAAVVGSSVALPPFGFAIAARERVYVKAIAPARARRNLALRDQELVLARELTESRPSRFFFSITERCNLRCEHCITHAPERTADGSARTLTPAVLDALRGDLGFADYFAFVHGGESLTAPIFFDVLSAIQAARGAEPYVAHLLSNGVLLSEAIVQRLVERGVRSLSISLDGATAATNDAIRVGGRFDDVRAKLASLLRWRSAKAVDLRVGLSFVVLAQNVSELEAFVDLGAELGVDWIKLEEGVPATPFAKRSLVACSEAEIRSAIDRALSRGRAKNIVMVDHTIDRTIWRCRLDDETRSFLEADEFANRGPIHPCRTPWETVCIEPNGDVRVLDFFGPIVGNVTQAPLAELWNAPAAQEARVGLRLSRICGPTGPVTCV